MPLIDTVIRNAKPGEKPSGCSTVAGCIWKSPPAGNGGG
jgi:hypothetical protein